MNAHTPGPWSRAWVAGALRHINRNVDDEAFYSPPPGEVLFETHRHPMRHEPDYDLVTAAPELLTALDDLLEAHRRVVHGEATHVSANLLTAAERVVLAARGGK